MSFSNVCMLCLHTSDALIEIFGRRGIELNVEAILKEYFWFQVDESEERKICEQCWWTVHDFHALYTSVKLNQLQQSVFYIKTEIADSNDYNELPASIDTIKDEPNIDTKYNLEDLPSDNPCIANTPCCLDVKETNDSPVPIPRVKRKYNRNSSPTEKVYKTDTHTTLLCTYFKMSCDLCDAPLPTYREAKIHFKNVHNIKRGYLICCNKKFHRLQAMLQHCQWHMNPDSFRCDLCLKTFIDSHRLRKHINACHASENGKVFQCNDCDKVFSKQQYLDVHIKNISHTSDFHEEHEMIRNRFLMQCDLCGQPFAIFRDVKMHHAKAHNQPGYLYCCDKKFFKMSRAVQHCMWHEDPKSLKCSICQICFVDKASLRHHIRKVHSPEAESFPKKSTMLSYMKVHIKDEKGVKAEKENIQFECHICRQGFLMLPLLKRHISRVHRSIPSHICELCAKPFTSGQAYKQHYINFHTNVSQKVQCEQCGKWMKNKITLTDHIRRHNSKTATCGICKRVFPNFKALQGHIRITHREASLECTVCGKMFKKQNVLKEHMAIHAGVTDLYTCTFCTKTFRSSANMYSHRKRTHPEELERRKAALSFSSTPATAT